MWIEIGIGIWIGIWIETWTGLGNRDWNWDWNWSLNRDWNRDWNRGWTWEWNQNQNQNQKESYLTCHFRRNHRQNSICLKWSWIGSNLRTGCKQTTRCNYRNLWKIGSTSVSGPISNRNFVGVDFQLPKLVRHNPEQFLICFPWHHLLQSTFH